MREIKFRVWDKGRRKIRICGEDSHDSMQFIDGEACYYNLQNGCGSLTNEKRHEGEYVLMQFTGLKEIYEGDVVTVRTKYGMDKGVVVFKDGAFMVYWDSTISFPTNGIVKTHYYLNGTNKVLGNIYTNPKLLAGEDD